MPTRTSLTRLLRRAAAWSSTPAGLGTLFAVGLAIRLVLSRGGGFPFDISSFSGWAGRLAERGPWDFYPQPGEQFFVDYPPGYLYVLWGLGHFTQALGGGAPTAFWLKLPPILADLGLAWLVGEAAVRLAPARLRASFDIRGPAAAAVLLNPAVFFVSAVWGQVDVFLALLVLGALLLLGTGTPTFRREAAGIALLAVAVGTKPQGVFALPMVLLFVVWRHIRPRLVDAEGSRTRALAVGIGRLVALAVVGAVAGFLLLAPFRLGPVQAFDFYARAGGTYSVTSVFAFNGWGTVGFWRPDSGGDAFRILGVPAFAWGLALFSFGGALVCARAWQRLRAGEEEGRVLFFGSASITLIGFAVLTRVHERYLFLPLALLAVFVGTRWLRRAFIALSALYLINVFFPYVYYLEYVGRPAPTLGGLVDKFYGTDIGGTQLKVLSAVTAIACLFVAARGWRGISAIEEVRPWTVPEPSGWAAVQRVDGWSIRLHPVGRRGLVIALLAFAVALGTRLPGLGHPPGMYFDEVYHARTGAEYLARKDVFEWTHPPLAKEFISLSIGHLSGFGARRGGGLPQGVTPRALTSGPEAFYWVESRADGARIRSAGLDDSCALGRPATYSAVTLLEPSRIAIDGGPVFIGGVAAEGPVLVRVDAQGERWRTALPAAAESIVALGDRAFVVTTAADLVFVSPDGDVRTVAAGVESIDGEADASPPGQETTGEDRVSAALPEAPSRKGIVWASHPAASEVSAWDADGRRSTVIDVRGRPSALSAIERTERLVVTTNDNVTVLDTKTGDVAHTIDARGDAAASVRETEFAWVSDGRRLQAVEPRSGVVIGGATLQRAPVALLSDPEHHRLVSVTDQGLECASGRPQFAWRLGSAVAGSLLVALVALLALRLFGNLVAAGLAALFVAVDGLAFTMSRIAIPESYTTAFLVAAWFCALSALYRWGCGEVRRSRVATLSWLVAAGLFGGAAGSSKWVAVYGFAGVGLVLLWDGFRRGKDGIFGVAGSPAAGVVVLGVCLGVLPLAVYVATYIPYFSLGHSVGDLISLQGQMYGYHANLDATHPFSAPWYGWPLGHRAVFLYLAGSGAERSEIWTIPNLVVFWGGLVAMAVMVRRAWSTRAAAVGLVVFAAVLQYIPWAAVGRVLFLYHYLPVVPFLAIALAWWITVGLREPRYVRPVTTLVVAAAVVMFVGVLPMLEGWSMPVSYLEGVRDALPWVIP